MEAAFACQVIFGVPADAMFPHVHCLIEEKTMRNIYKEHHRLENTTSPLGLRKQQLYSLALARAIGRAGNKHRI